MKAKRQTEVASNSGTITEGFGGHVTWAARKVLESYGIRAIDGPAARCVPGGVPRVNTQGLFPMKIVHAPQEIVSS
jgi:hypothetical protein